MLALKPQTHGPQLPEAFKDRTFRSYTDLANFAEEHQLPVGHYWVYNSAGTSLITRLREVKVTKTSFWVEGRGNI